MNDRPAELPNVIPESVMEAKRKMKALTRPRLCLTMALSDETQENEEAYEMMQEIYLKKAYPPEVLRAVLNSGRLGAALANRWMLGWPETVKALMVAGEYAEAFKNQLEQELDALATAQDSSHLAEMEIIAMAGLAMGPPTIS